MKKVLAIVLCLMLLASAAMADVVYNAPGEYPIANEIVTIKILAPQDGEYSRSENLQTIELEEKLGIKIEWEIEQRVDFSRWVEQGFGTADCVIIGDGTMHVVDFKYGLGVLVSAEDNPQIQLTPENTKLYVDDGTVTYAPVTDGYREGLKYLNTLYEEKLLNPESFTQDKNNQVSVNEAGDVCVIGCFLAQRPGYACDLSTYPGNSKKWEQYQPLAPLTNSETGQCIAAWSPYVMYQTGMTFITKASRNPEAAFRLIDYLATEEGSIRSAYGIEGKQWRYAEEGEFGLDGEPAYITSIPNSDTNVSWTQLAGLIRDTRFTVWLTTNPDPYAEGVKPLDGRQVVLYKGSKLHEEVRQPLESVMPSLFFSEDVSSRISKLNTDVTDIQMQLMVAFIKGDIDIDDDAAWADYLAQLETAGLSEFLELYQEAYENSAFAK